MRGRGPAPWPTRGRRRTATIAGILVVILLAVGIAYFLVRWPRGAAPPRTIPPAGPTTGQAAPLEAPTLPPAARAT